MATKDILANQKVKLNHWVFWPPFLLVLIATVLNLFFPKQFGDRFKQINEWVLVHFGWLFVVAAFASFFVCVGICFSPFGRIRLGGKNSKPLLRFWDWFTITLCTTVAVGILFWSTSEPLFHYQSPPKSLGIPAESEESYRFAIAALFLHWTFIPYAIYCAASLIFAFAHYNMKLPFTLGSTLVPILGRDRSLRIGQVVDAICLYSLVAGMAASLGTGILTISGGLNELVGIPRQPWVWALIALAIVVTFIVSSATGLMNGIRILSDINAKALFLLGFLVLVMGPLLVTLKMLGPTILEFVVRFFQVGFKTSLIDRDEWAQSWSIFYWAVWIAWTPITACFLGRIAYGRTVREFMLVNFILPACFSVFWMATFGIAALQMQVQGTPLLDQLTQLGPESISYTVLRAMPFGWIMCLFYLLSAFVCFVTSADSNTTAMSAISSKGVSLENPEGRLEVKVAWGSLVGIAAFAMITFADVEGIKYLSNLGGLPTAFLLILMLISLVYVVARHKEFNIVDQESASETPINH